MRLTVQNLQSKIAVNPVILKKIAKKCPAPKDGKRTKEITVLLTNDVLMKELNLIYTGRNSATDVLSFDSSENNKELRLDIAISADTAIRNAKVFKTSALYEVYLYLVHGILHSSGFDDATQKERDIMQNKAESILDKICQSTKPKQ